MVPGTYNLSPIEFEEKHYADQANLKPRQPILTS
jgi:hypothetical protein